MVDETPMTQEAAPADLFKEAQPNVLDAMLKDKAAAREAFIAAEKAVGMDAVVDPQAVLAQNVQPTVKVPEQFKTPTGEVDVEKLKASAKQLDQAIQNKEQRIQEVDKSVSVEDLVKDYNDRLKKFRSTPNPEKVAAAFTPPPPPPPPMDPSMMSNEQLLNIINQDIQRNPAKTVVDLIDLALERKKQEWIEPIQEERQVNKMRENLSELASRDPRILADSNFTAVKAKLDANPELWNLKNPYKVAWLEVKEEMRLGEPSQVQAQPSRPAAPILGGGTPPPPQSAGAEPITSETVFSAISQANFKDPNQKRNLEAALREMVDRDFRARR